MTLDIRKIESREASDRRSRKNILVLSIIMISILVLSIAGYFSIGENEGRDISEGVQNIGDYWIFNHEENIIRVSNSLESTKNVSIINSKKISDYRGKIVYLASEYEAWTYEISSVLQNYAGRIQRACYGNCSENLPEKNCNDTMIVMTELNISEGANGKIYEQNNCVFIEGDLRAIDAFIYQLFDIN